VCVCVCVTREETHLEVVRHEISESQHKAYERGGDGEQREDLHCRSHDRVRGPQERQWVHASGGTRWNLAQDDGVPQQEHAHCVAAPVSYEGG
jgi:sarcosine oxidase delta subunit